MGDHDTTTAHRTIELDVAGSDAGERFDRWLAKAAGISRQRAMDLLADGKVRVGRRRPRKGDPVEAGQHVVVELPAPDAPVPQPDLPLAVVAEDASLLGIDKPAGIAMHPLEPGERNTLANAVLARFPDVAGASGETRCPGLIHRLDRETSGIVLWARTREAFDHVRAQFAARTVEKRYHVLVDGFIEGAGELAVPLAHDPSDDRKMVATPYPSEAEALKARPATTRYRSLGHASDATLLEVEIPTGVMHQIRAHFAFVGHPVLGDALYGGRDVGSSGRHLLHASSIGFRHPASGEATTWRSPIPADFAGVLATLGIDAP